LITFDRRGPAGGEILLCINDYSNILRKLYLNFVYSDLLSMAMLG